LPELEVDSGGSAGFEAGPNPGKRGDCAGFETSTSKLDFGFKMEETEPQQPESGLDPSPCTESQQKNF
jgi:hypothetical protein